jgi:hypothetical protein
LGVGKLQEEHGRGKIWLLLEAFLRGGWEVDKWHGWGKVMYSDGAVYEGSWKCCKRHTSYRHSPAQRLNFNLDIGLYIIIVKIYLLIVGFVVGYQRIPMK